MKRLLFIASILLACGWGLYVAAGPRLASAVAGRAGRTIASLGEGKVASPVNFVQYRMRETLSSLNPLGVKGVGESGTLPVAAVIASAVEDALAEDGVVIREMPLPPRILGPLIPR